MKKALCVVGAMSLIGAIVVVSAVNQNKAIPAAIPSREPDGEFLLPEPFSPWDTLFTPDGSQLVIYGSAAKKGMIHFYQFDSKKLIRSLAQGGDHVSAAVFTPDGKQLITTAVDGNLRCFAGPDWDVEDLFNCKPAVSYHRYLAMSPDGKRFLSASASTNADLRNWHVSDRSSTPLRAGPRLIYGLSISNDGRLFAENFSTNEGASVAIWDFERLNVIGALHVERDSFYNAVFSDDQKWIATGMSSNRVVLWDRKTLLKKKELTAPYCPERIAFTKDSKLLICCTGSHAGTDGELILASICIWIVETGKLAYAFRPYMTTSTNLLALSPDERWLVTWGQGHGLSVWDLGNIRKEIGN